MSDLTPPLKWHGGKHYLAKRIVALMPPHTHYVEPFFGGGSVLLAKDPEGVSEVVNDLSGLLMNFWQAIAGTASFEEFKRKAEATPFAEHAWKEAADIVDDWGRYGWPRSHPFVPAALAFFVCCRQSLAGRMKSFAPLSRTRTRRRMNEQAAAWLSAVEGLPAVHERLKRVAIVGPKPAARVIEQQDGPATVFYLDPPYLHETRASTGEYAHEMSGVEHLELLELLGSIDGKFILSGYPSEMYDEKARFYGWRVVDIDAPNNAAGGDSKRRMTERLWLNFPERGTP